MNEVKLTKIQNIAVGTISSLGMVTLYGTGVKLARTFTEHHNPIFVTTIACSFISPYLLSATTKFVLKKYNQKKEKNRQKSLKREDDKL